MAIEKPAGLTSAGKRFWDFLFDEQQADGNDHNSLLRKDLLPRYRQDLAASSFDDCMMEMDHGFIQWLFPLPTEGVNPRAPILSKKDFELIGAVPEAREKLLEHFHLFIDFLGIKPKEKTFEKYHAERWGGWINSPHNNLRISRVLESMTDFGLGDLSKSFYDFLNQESTRRNNEGDFIPYLPVTHDSCQRFWVNSQNGTNWSRIR